MGRRLIYTALPGVKTDWRVNKAENLCGDGRFWRSPT
jgi:hypothetical protein